MFMRISGKDSTFFAYLCAHFGYEKVIIVSSPLLSPRFRLRAGGLDGFTRAGNDHLAVAVVVGGDDGAFAGGTDLLHLLVRQADDGSHRTGHFLAAFLHFGRPQVDEAQRIFKRDGVGRGEGGEFAQGVAGDHVGPEVLQALGQDDGVQEDGRLGDLRCFQVFRRPFEHDVGDSESKDLVGSLKQFLRLGEAIVEIFRHSGELRPLTGEKIGFLHKKFHFISY